jgi:hypothetical protein
MDLQAADLAPPHTRALPSRRRLQILFNIRRAGKDIASVTAAVEALEQTYARSPEDAEEIRQAVRLELRKQLRKTVRQAEAQMRDAERRVRRLRGCPPPSLKLRCRPVGQVSARRECRPTTRRRKAVGCRGQRSRSSGGDPPPPHRRRGA